MALRPRRWHKGQKPKPIHPADVHILAWQLKELAKKQEEERVEQETYQRLVEAGLRYA